MDRERQEPPQRPRGPQNPASWSYEQNQPGMPPRPPGMPPVSSQQGPLAPNPYPPNQPNVPTPYAEPIVDIGATLGYGQGTEYQYFQPSQPLPKLRQERLQQLRQERLRRDGQHARPDVTSSLRGRKGNAPDQAASFSAAPPQAASSARAIPQASMPPSSLVEPANEPSQNTAMIKKLRIGRASAILMAAFVASRVLGLVRTSMFAATFGTGPFSDAFVQASLIPDTIFNIIAGGALSTAFIPTFTKYMVGEKNEEMAWQIANTALTLAVVGMVVLSIVGAIFAYPLVWLYSPGYRNDPTTLNLMANLVRIMLLQAIILGGGVIITSVLNAKQDFQMPAIGTVLYNVGNIIGLLPGLFLTTLLHHRGDSDVSLAVYCAAGGVVLGAALNIGVQIPGLIKVGMRYKPNFNWHLPGIVQIGRQMVPRVFNASVFSLTTFVDRFLIGLLAVGAVDGLITQYYQATQLVMLPLGIFGMAMSTAAFPTLAEYVAQERWDRVRSVILDTLRNILFLSIPSSVGLMILAEPIIQALLAHGHFTIPDAVSTSIPLIFFSVGLAGLAAIEILTRSFYAMRDSKTPVVISILQFAWKIAVGLILIDPFFTIGGSIWGSSWAPSAGMGALALSTSLANLAEAIVLFIVLNRRIKELWSPNLLNFILRVLGASACMGVVVLVVLIVLNAFTAKAPTSSLVGIGLTLVKLSIELFVGLFVFLRAARFFKLEELVLISRLLERFKLSWML